MTRNLFVFVLSLGLTLGEDVPPPVKPEPRQAPVKPEPRQSSCNFAYTFTAAGQQAILQSPSYPNNYPPNSNCKYSLQSPQGTIIELRCNEFNVEAASGCQYDVFSFSLSGNAALSDATRTCGSGTFARNSTGNALTIGFTSDSGNPYSPSPYRFQCYLTAISTSAPAPPAATTQAPATTTAPAATTASAPATCSCGVRNEAMRIVGGTEAKVNEFPWRCNLYNPNMGVFCGATVISESYVLTAAHCTAAVPAGTTLYVDCADHDISQTGESANVVIKVAQIIQNTAYNKDTQDNDISLLKLETPLTFSRTIQPVCLPWKMTGSNFDGLTVTASGWGTTSSGGSQSPVLKKVDLPTLSTEKCQKYYGTSVTQNMICTYAPGSDTCQGDSGGSIDYKDPSTGKYIDIGVVSWGVGCAGQNQPGVYTKLSNYLNWITANTAGTNFCKI